MWLPIVVHSEPLITPIFFTDRMVKNKSLSARSFQFLLFMIGESMASYSHGAPREVDG